MAIITKFKHWLPAIIWAGFIFFLSSRQFGGPPLFPGADKIIHICIYMVLGYFVAKALIKGHEFERYQVIIIATLVAGVYGLTDEVHQSFVPGRSVEMLDLLSDFLGGFLGALIISLSPWGRGRG